MTKIITIYDNKSDNTKKMALAVAEGARRTKTADATVKKVDQASVEDLCSYEGIVMSSINQKAEKHTC